MSRNNHESPGMTYLTTANDALALVVTERALVADSNKSCWADIAIANWTFPVTFIAQSADSDSWLLSAHDEVTVIKVSS